MLTIFAIPKPFTGHARVIQRNAIAAWTSLRPRPEIILLGSETGVGEVAAEFGGEWVPDLDKTPYGTPLLGDGFRQVMERARFPILAYVNCDIILTQGLVESLRAIPFPKFLAVGRRTNVEVSALIMPDEIEDPGFPQRLARSGVLETPFAIDYFLFAACPEIGAIPPFAVGRPGWDNWMIYNAISKGIPVIDMTDGVLAIHQNHDYRHIPDQRGVAWEGPEADYNRRLAGSPVRLKYSMLDATHRYSPQLGCVARALGPAAMFKRLIADHPGLRWPLEILGFPWLYRERCRRRRLKRAGYV